jgi:hypothetical protein
VQPAAPSHSNIETITSESCTQLGARGLRGHQQSRSLKGSATPAVPNHLPPPPAAATTTADGQAGWVSVGPAPRLHLPTQQHGQRPEQRDHPQQVERVSSCLLSSLSPLPAALASSPPNTMSLRPPLTPARPAAAAAAAAGAGAAGRLAREQRPWLPWQWLPWCSAAMPLSLGAKPSSEWSFGLPAAFGLL